MSTSAKAPGSIIVSCLRYQDALKALEWLSDAFGFEEHLVVPDEGGGIAHAQLKMGSGMIMLGSARDDNFGRLVKPPESTSAATTQSCYVIVDDLTPTAQGRRRPAPKSSWSLRIRTMAGDFTSAAIENVWAFGSYDPWAAENA